MIASVHIADVGARSLLSVLRRAPQPADAPGLRHADVAMGALLAGAAVPKPTLGRAVLIGFWDDDDALDAFLAGGHATARALADGFRVRLRPLRAWGSWPGLPGPPEVPQDRHVDHEGPAAVVTLGRLKAKRAPAFFKASRGAAGAAADAEGLRWGTAMARPPFFATFSIWESTKDLSTYAYGRRQPAHSNALDEGRVQPFHHQEAFIRFQPYRAEGALDGANPLPAVALEDIAAP